MVYMPSTTSAKKALDKPRNTANNDRLRVLVEATGLSRAGSLALYNKGLHVLARCSDHSWKSYFSDPDSERWRHVRNEVLERAEKVFGPMGQGG